MDLHKPGHHHIDYCNCDRDQNTVALVELAIGFIVHNHHRCWLGIFALWELSYWKLSDDDASPVSNHFYNALDCLRYRRMARKTENTYLVMIVTFLIAG